MISFSVSRLEKENFRLEGAEPPEFIVLADGDVETNWREWVQTNSYLIDPVLEELNELIAK